MIDHDQVDRDVAITATIAGTTGVLAVGDVTDEFTAHSPDLLRETVMSRVLVVAAEVGGPVQMTISEDGTETVLLVAPDGETAAVDALLPARTARSAAAPRRRAAGAAGGALVRPGVTVLVATGTLVAVLILVGALLLAGGDEKEPASADVGPTSPSSSTSEPTAPSSAPTSEPTLAPLPRLRPKVKVSGGENRLSVRVTTNRVAKVRWVLIGPNGRTLESDVVRVGPKGWTHTRKPTQAGDYSWRVEPVATRGVTARGAVQVTAPTPPPVEEPEDPTYTPPPTYSPPPSNDGGGNTNDGGGGQHNGGGGQDPPDPVDPDDVPTPIDPDDPR